MTKVSFIIPYYNNGDTIQETLDSVFAQTFKEFDVWIIDDGSTDEISLAVLEKISTNEKIKILRQHNAGPSIARNSAIQKCDSEIVVPLDADDKIKPEALEHAFKFLLNDEKIGAVYGNNTFFGEKHSETNQQELDIRKLLVYNQVAMCSFIRKKVFETCGYFDEFMSKRGLEDWEFWIRITEAGWKLKHVNEQFFEIRVREKSRTYEVANKNLEELKNYVTQKHAVTFRREYLKLFYENKMLKETPDYRIGNAILKPYRFFKNLLE
jgi:glycosyltransferase involved in cell wall biosynthesis